MPRARLRRLFQESPLLLKLFASLVLPSFLAVVVVTVILSSLFSARARDDLDRINALRLQGIQAQMEVVVASSLRLSYLLANNQSLLDAFGSLRQDPMSYSQATTQMNQFLLAAPYVDSVVLAQANRVVYSLFLRDSYRESRDQMLGVLRNPGAPHLRNLVRSGGQVGRVLTFVTNQSNRADYIDAAAAVNLNLDLLLQDLFGATGGDEDRTLALLDSDGQLLADSHWMWETGPVLTQAAREAVRTDPRSSGILPLRSGGRAVVVAFTRSFAEGFTVVTAVDYESYMRGLTGLGVQTLLWSSLVMVLLFVGIVVIAYRFYRPLDSMYRRVQSLGRRAEAPDTVHDLAHAAQVLEQTEQRLDSGERSPALWGRLLTRPDAAELEAAGLLPALDGLWVAVAAADGGGDLDPATLERWREFRGVGSGPAFPWVDRQCVLLGQLGAGAGARSALGAALRPWIDRDPLSFSVGVAWGSVDDLPAAYALATARCRARVLAGPRSLVFEAPADPAPLGPLLERLEHATAAGDRERAEAAFHDLLARPASDRTFAELLAAGEAMGRVEARLGRSNAPFADRTAASRALEACRGGADVLRWLAEVYEGVRAGLDAVGGVRALDLVNRALAYLEAHASDVQLSAGGVAESLAISPQYFSRIFKEHAGSSFPEYLKRLRLDKAKALLADRALSLGEVGTAAGFGNKAYFTTAFKERFGITPGKLRSTLLRDAAASEQA